MRFSAHTGARRRGRAHLVGYVPSPAWLRCPCLPALSANDFELGIQRVPRMHFFQEPTRSARKRKKHVAYVLRKEGGTRSSEGENLQSMHHRSGVPVSTRVFDIVVDRVIVSRNRLESGGMRIRQCAAWGAEYVADA